MPYPFVLPTTSSFSFSSSFDCQTHPSLPLHASTQRGVAKDALKKHKRLPPSSQTGHLTVVMRSIKDYVPYLLAVTAGLHDKTLPNGEVVSINPKAEPKIKWRPTLSGDTVPGRERSRVHISSLEDEISFVLSSLAFAQILSSRAILQPLHATNSNFVGSQERTTAISTATKSLLDAASIFNWLAARSERVVAKPSCVDIAPTTVHALSALAHAEATLLAVLKDDPYPAVVAQDRNKHDKEWMFKSPEIPKVRAHLYARLCLAASEHAARAASLAQPSGTGAVNKIESGLTRYIEDVRRTSRAKACRFLGIDAELGGDTADGIGWLRAGLMELGVNVKDGNGKKGLSLSRLKKELVERMEDRRVEKETTWGSDGGKLEEMRVIELLDEKWNKINDTMNTKAIPQINTLLGKIPSGRNIHEISVYQPPSLDRDMLDSMRSMPDGADEFLNDASSEDEFKGSPDPTVWAYPGDDSDPYERNLGSHRSHNYF